MAHFAPFARDPDDRGGRRPDDRHPDNRHLDERRPDDRRPDDSRPGEHRGEGRYGDRRREPDARGEARFRGDGPGAGRHGADVHDAGPEETLLVGRVPVREALERGDRRLEKIFLPHEARGPLADLHRLARTAAVPVQFVPPQRLDHMTRGANHQGVVATLSGVAFLDIDEMLDAIAPTVGAVMRTSPLVVALDGIEDPHNVGAIVRSAVAAGAAGVVLPSTGGAPLSTVAIKASAGTALSIRIARVPSLVRMLENVKERGYWVVGAAGGEGSDRHTAYDWTRPTVLVVGSEGRGLSVTVRKACDVLVGIAMPGPAESLNASVAAGVLLFEAVRQRTEVRAEMDAEDTGGEA